MTTKIATTALTDEALARLLPYGVSVAGASGIAMTVATSGAIALGAGTLSISSINNATIANHTHYITGSSDPGANASILYSDASGYLDLESITLSGMTLQGNVLLQNNIYFYSDVGVDTIIKFYNNNAYAIMDIVIDGGLAVGTSDPSNVQSENIYAVGKVFTNFNPASGVRGELDIAQGYVVNIDHDFYVLGTTARLTLLNSGTFTLNLAGANFGTLAFSVSGTVATVPETMTLAGRNVANTFTGINTWSAESNTFFHASSATSGEHYPILSQIVAEPTGSSSAYYRGLIFNALQNSTAALTQAAGGLVGIFGSVYLTNAGLVTLGIGVQARIQAYGANNTNIVEGRGFDAGVINWGGGGTMTMGIGSNFYSRNPVGAALSLTGTFYGFYSEDINKAGTNYAWYSNAGNVLFNAGGDVNTNFTVRSDSYDALVVAASDNAIKVMNHVSGKIGFFGATPIVRTDAYTVTNRTPDRSYNCDATNAAELADVLGTLIYDLQQYGLLQ